MPIKVTCACGQSFAAEDELAGKTVKCPKCAQPLKIGAPSSQTVAPARSAPAAGRSAAPPSAMNSLFDDAGVKAAAPVGAQLCPGCAQPVTPGAVLCIKCGYNFKLGRKMQTMGASSAAVGGGGDGHGHDVASGLMARAAESIEDAEDAERSKTSEGLPWWGYLIALGGVVGFMVMMMALPMAIAFTTAAVFLFLIGFLVSIYSAIRLLMVAFAEGTVHGLLYLFFSPYQLYYIVTRWDSCSGFFMMNCAGVGIVLVGAGFWWLAGIAANWKTEEQTSLPRNQAIVVVIEQIYADDYDLSNRMYKQELHDELANA